MGEEDKISLRLDPEDLGIFCHRFSKIWNMTKPAEVLSLNTSGHIWAGNALSQGVIERIQEVVARNPKSKKFDDQVKQKQLYIDMAEMLPSFQNLGNQGIGKS